MPNRARDSKDPMPTADFSQRLKGGNVPVGHPGTETGHAKAEHIKGDQRFTIRTGGETQPTRQGGDGNTPVTGELHGQKKAERVSAESRFGLG